MNNVRYGTKIIARQDNSLAGDEELCSDLIPNLSYFVNLYTISTVLACREEMCETKSENQEIDINHSSKTYLPVAHNRRTQ